MYLYLNLYLLRMRAAAVLRRNGRIRSYSPPPSPLRPLHCSFKTILNSSRQLFGDKIHKTAPAHAVLKVVPGLKKRSTPKSMLFVIILVFFYFQIIHLGPREKMAQKIPKRLKMAQKSPRGYISAKNCHFLGVCFLNFFCSGHSKWDLHWTALEK